VESRTREMLDELEGAYRALVQGKISGNDALRALSDIKDRSQAAGTYLDNMPPAVGQDATQVHYEQAIALLQQACSLVHDYVGKNDADSAEAMKDAILEARRELDTAYRRLIDVKAAQEPARPITVRP
jgi:hypothetical protein